MTDIEKINSDGYWNSRFTENWEACEGPKQSRFFARIAVEHLPRWLIEQLKRQPLTLADWGCAQGDGTDVWASYIKAQQIVGIDFSSVAIKQAAQRYPAIRFICEDWLAETSDQREIFDVVFSSNTLEHFHKPYDTLHAISKRAKKAIVLAIPFKELERIDEHFFSFLPENIPLQLANGFRLIWSQVVNCRSLPKTLWTGDQVILAYVDPDWLDSLGLTLSDCHIEQFDTTTEINSVNATLVEQDNKIVNLTESIVERDSQNAKLSESIADLDRHNAKLSESIADLDRQNAKLSESIAELDRQNAKLSESIVERDRQNAKLSESIVERDRQNASLSESIVDLERQKAKFSEIIVERDENLVLINVIKRSASWRLTRPLRFAKRLARFGLISEDRKRLSQTLREYYYRVPMPASAKRLISSIYHRMFKKPAPTLQKSSLSTTQFCVPSIKLTPNSNDYPDYIFWGVIDWHFRHQRPQQLAMALAITGRRVIYISSNFADDERAGYEIESLDDFGLLFQVKLFVKGAPAIYTSAPGVESVSQLRASIGEVLDWANCQQIISFVQHPFWHDVASVIPNSRLVYDCMDHHDGFGNNAESLLKLEELLIQEAELTITTSTWLDKAVAPHAKKRALIRNAGDYQHFSTMPDNVYRDPLGRRIIGYYGAIAEWFDLDLVVALAKQHPECCVLLIGADTVNAQSKLGRLSNVTFTGEVPYNKLPYYLYSFDICLLPFKVIPLTLATNPVKAYEYLSSGKPVIAVELPEMAQFEALIYTVAGKDAFLAAIDTLLRQPEPDTLIQQRKIFAQGQTWNHRAQAIIRYSESAADDPKVSVVVVTYNNLEFTRACLASLDEYSQHAHMEIIVVDNASSDRSQDFLSEWVINGKNRKIILNEDNRGFSAANNQGLAIATGDYLVLLNNDTYVTPGWIRTMLKHLQRDKNIGLIGPVTNNIGNEAKIDIHYSDMSEMLVKSAAYTRRHIGQTYPLRTAAFFCVMMSRSIYERVGALDEAFGRGFFEDDDYCRRIEKLNLRVVCAEDVFIHHHLSASFNKLKQQDRKKLFDDNKKIYEAKWGEWVHHSFRKN